MKRHLLNVCTIITIMALAGCASYHYKAVPFTLPSSQPGHVDIDGVYVSATAYLSSEYAKSRFGFDIRKAGLLPVQVVMDNQSGKKVTIDPFQTFLIDNSGQAWSILPEQEAYKRIKDYGAIGHALGSTVKPAALLGATGALLGFAVGIVSGHEARRNAEAGAVIGATTGALASGVKSWSEAEEEIRRDLLGRSLKSRPIEPGELVHGFLFFPGKKEALSARSLRLAIRIGGREKIVNVPLTVR